MGLASILNAFLDREQLWNGSLSQALPASIASLLPESIGAMETSHAGVVIWIALCIGLILLCLGRVLTHVKEPQVMASALLKLTSPLLLAICPFLLPLDVLYDSARYVSFSLGLVYCLITTKLIFLSMAKMPFAVFQGDIYPMVALCLWVGLDQRLTLLGSKTLFQLCCMWYMYRFYAWASVAMEQICARLDIFVFTIKDKKTKAD